MDLNHLIEERYRESASRIPLLSNSTIEAMLNHRTVRNFLPHALPEGTLETLIAAAQSAPTSSNIQAWSVVVVRDPTVKAELAALAGNQSHIETAPLFLVFIADLARASALGKRRGFNMSGLDFVESFLLAAIDATLAAQNALVAAESLGLGTVCIGGIRNKALEVAEKLALPQKCFGVFGMCVGYPDPQRPASVKPRLPQQVVVHHDRYDLDAMEPAITRYEVNLATFRQEQAMSEIGWTTQMTNRLKDAGSLHGRHILRDSLRCMGFPLA